MALTIGPTPDVDSDDDTLSWAGVTRAAGFDAFATTPTSANLNTLVTDETGSGLLVFATSPSLTTPLLGTPTSGNLANCTGYLASGLGGLGTGVATALAINVGSAGAFVTLNGALGTPSSGTLSSATGLPVSTGISGLGANVATALAVAVGSAGALVTFNGAGGTPSSLTLTNATGLPNASVVGLGTAALVNTGTSGATIPLLNGNNTASGLNIFTRAGNPIELTNSGGGGFLIALKGSNALDGYVYSTAASFVLKDASQVDRLTLGFTSGLLSVGHIVVGSPTGGDKGAGTVNATAVYDDNVLLTDLVLDFAASGSFDAKKYYYHPLVKEVAAWWFDPDQYAEFWKAERRLPGMLSWNDPAGRPSTGESITRLTAVAETLAALLDKAFSRISALERALETRPAQ